MESGEGNLTGDLGCTVASDGRYHSDSQELGEPEFTSGGGGVGETTARIGSTAAKMTELWWLQRMRRVEHNYRWKQQR